MKNFLKFLFDKKSRKQEILELQADIEKLEEERLKAKTSHRVGQAVKTRLIEQIQEKRKELQQIQLQTEAA